MDLFKPTPAKTYNLKPGETMPDDVWENDEYDTFTMPGNPKKYLTAGGVRHWKSASRWSNFFFTILGSIAGAFLYVTFKRRR